MPIFSNVEGKISSSILSQSLKALLRIAALYDIPVATNQSTADFLITSPIMNATYERKIIDYAKRIQRRTLNYTQNKEME